MVWCWHPLALLRWRPQRAADVRVRPVRWHDAARWVSGRRVDLLELPPGMAGLSLWALAVGAIWPVRRERLLLRSEHPRLGTGWIAVQPEPRPEHWLMTQFLQPYTEDLSAYLPLLDELARFAGRYGVQRIHALVPWDSPIVELFQQAGFWPFRRITVFVAKVASLSLPDPAPAVRSQTPHDGWAILRLYERVTPRPVVYAEGRTRASWQPGRRAGWRVRGVVLPHESEILAYCQVRSRAHVHVVEMLVDPSIEPHADSVLAAALQQAKVLPRDVVVALVPDDAPGLLGLFHARGFELVDRRAWVARYLTRTARVRASQHAAAMLRELPELVPGLLRGLPQRQLSGSRSHFTIG